MCVLYFCLLHMRVRPLGYFDPVCVVGGGGDACCFVGLYMFSYPAIGVAQEPSGACLPSRALLLGGVALLLQVSLRVQSASDPGRRVGACTYPAQFGLNRHAAPDPLQRRRSRFGVRRHFYIPAVIKCRPNLRYTWTMPPASNSRISRDP
jgi:hypothetical protein